MWPPRTSSQGPAHRQTYTGWRSPGISTATTPAEGSRTGGKPTSVWQRDRAAPPARSPGPAADGSPPPFFRAAPYPPAGPAAGKHEQKRRRWPPLTPTRRGVVGPWCAPPKGRLRRSQSGRWRHSRAPLTARRKTNQRRGGRRRPLGQQPEDQPGDQQDETTHWRFCQRSRATQPRRVGPRIVASRQIRWGGKAIQASRCDPVVLSRGLFFLAVLWVAANWLWSGKVDAVLRPGLRSDASPSQSPPGAGSGAAPIARPSTSATPKLDFHLLIRKQFESGPAQFRVFKQKNPVHGWSLNGIPTRAC